jgi:hypothetical protein
MSEIKMSEINTLRDMRPAPPPAELEAMRMAVRERFVAGNRPRRARQRWRMPALAGGLTVAVAAAAAAALVLTSGPGTIAGQHRTAGHTGTVTTAAWTVRENADGTVTIYLRQYGDITSLQRTLQADGIDAIIFRVPAATKTIGKATYYYPTCTYPATDAAPQAVQHAVVTVPGRRFPPGPVTPANAPRFIIHPDAMPHGSALLLWFTSDLVTNPVVLKSDTKPACVPINFTP